MSGSPTRPFVLLDRDGTIITERRYLADPAGVELLPGTGEALRLLRKLGYGLAVLTNQSGIARGMFTTERLCAIHERVCELLASEGVALDGIYWCRHHPDEGCDCRKPNPGLALRAARELSFDVRQAIVIGDNVCDIELADRLGATSMLVLTGHGLTAQSSLTVQPDFVAANMREASEIIERMHAKRLFA
jgi:D-glycero-D-manno-heptose 1,7-bisphosphate phosphatase